MQRSFTFAAAALAAVLSCAPAFAAPAAQPQRVERNVRVPSSDLNLNTPDGARVMAQRILRAANRACGGRETWDLGRRAVHTCRSAAIDTALTALNAPLVTAAVAGGAQPTTLARR